VSYRTATTVKATATQSVPRTSLMTRAFPAPNPSLGFCNTTINPMTTSVIEMETAAAPWISN
jgi:hypothetical protein